MAQVKVKITAVVHTTIEMSNDETIEDIKKRSVDIYLHGKGSEGWLDKEDLGSDEVTMEFES